MTPISGSTSGFTGIAKAYLKWRGDRTGDVDSNLVIETPVTFTDHVFLRVPSAARVTLIDYDHNET